MLYGVAAMGLTGVIINFGVLLGFSMIADQIARDRRRARRNPNPRRRVSPDGPVKQIFTRLQRLRTSSACRCFSEW